MIWILWLISNYFMYYLIVLNIFPLIKNRFIYLAPNGGIWNNLVIELRFGWLALVWLCGLFIVGSVLIGVFSCHSEHVYFEYHPWVYHFSLYQERYSVKGSWDTVSIRQSCFYFRKFTPNGNVLIEDLGQPWFVDFQRKYKISHWKQ